MVDVVSLLAADVVVARRDRTGTGRDRDGVANLAVQIHRAVLDADRLGAAHHADGFGLVDRHVDVDVVDLDVAAVTANRALAVEARDVLVVLELRVLQRTFVAVETNARDVAVLEVTALDVDFALAVRTVEPVVRERTDVTVPDRDLSRVVVADEHPRAAVATARVFAAVGKVDVRDGTAAIARVETHQHRTLTGGVVLAFNGDVAHFEVVGCMALEDAATRAVGAEIDVEVLDGEVADRVVRDTQFEHVAGCRADLDRRAVAVQREIVETGDPYRVVYLVDGIGVEIDRPPTLDLVFELRFLVDVSRTDSRADYRRRGDPCDRTQITSAVNTTIISVRLLHHSTSNDIDPDV